MTVSKLNTYPVLYLSVYLCFPFSLALNVPHPLAPSLTLNSYLLILALIFLDFSMSHLPSVFHHSSSPSTFSRSTLLSYGKYHFLSKYLLCLYRPLHLTTKAPPHLSSQFLLSLPDSSSSTLSCFLITHSFLIPDPTYSPSLLLCMSTHNTSNLIFSFHLLLHFCQYSSPSVKFLQVQIYLLSLPLSNFFSPSSFSHLL